MMSPNYTGRTIDKRYQIQRELGRGGMGSVYLARHVILGHQVAVKLLHGRHGQKRTNVKRFYREAQASAAIGHENIIQVFDVGFTDDDDPYIVMEYLQGESLAAMLDRAKPLGLPVACGILEPALRALEAAHEKGIVHRDLKPDNIFLVHANGRGPKVKLIDFGISKFADREQATQLTRENAILGTPSFMAPEQVAGASEVDGRADVYSVGVILYYMLTGGLPFPGTRISELFLAILTGEPRPPTEVNPHFPTEVLPLVMKSLARDPDARFQSAAELRRALQQLRGETDPQAALWTMTAPQPPQGCGMGHLGLPGKRPSMERAQPLKREPRQRGKKTRKASARALLDEIARKQSGPVPRPTPHAADAPTRAGCTIPAAPLAGGEPLPVPPTDAAGEGPHHPPARRSRWRKTAVPRSVLAILTTLAILASFALLASLAGIVDGALLGKDMGGERALPGPGSEHVEKAPAAKPGAARPSPTGRAAADHPRVDTPTRDNSFAAKPEKESPASGETGYPGERKTPSARPALRRTPTEQSARQQTTPVKNTRKGHKISRRGRSGTKKSAGKSEHAPPPNPGRRERNPFGTPVSFER